MSFEWKQIDRQRLKRTSSQEPGARSSQDQMDRPMQSARDENQVPLETHKNSRNNGQMSRGVVGLKRTTQDNRSPAQVTIATKATFPKAQWSIVPRFPSHTQCLDDDVDNSGLGIVLGRVCQPRAQPQPAPEASHRVWRQLEVFGRTADLSKLVNKGGKTVILYLYALYTCRSSLYQRPALMLAAHECANLEDGFFEVLSIFWQAQQSPQNIATYSEWRVPTSPRRKLINKPGGRSPFNHNYYTDFAFKSRPSWCC